MKKNSKTQKTIKAQTLRGFRDLFGTDARIRSFVVDTFKKTFEKYGYEPLETPALEYADVLLGKSGDEMDKMSYIFKDPGGRMIGLKYDMTVPACRFIAENFGKLTFPLKRYQIQLAWRAEKPQKGRFREFMQCDADVWGSKSVLVDGEFIQMGIEIIKKLGFKNFVARINNRKIINGVFRYSGAKKDKFYDIAISVDKLEKIGAAGVKKELLKRKVKKEVVKKVMDIVTVKGSYLEKLNKIKTILKNDKEAQEGIKEIKEIFTYLKNARVKEKFYQFDPSIIRGMAYYTGPVWEFTIIEGNVGSIAGCGRYDKLTSLYLGKNVPASGGSFGIERIIEVLKDRKMLKLNSNLSKVLVTIFSPKFQENSVITVNKLRQKGVASELYLIPKKSLNKQVKYADKKNIPYVLIIGPDEAKQNKLALKNMKTGKQEVLNFDEVLKKLKEN